MNDETTKPTNSQSLDDLEALNTIVSAFRKLDLEGQKRVFDAVATLLGHRPSPPPPQSAERSQGYRPAEAPFSEDRTISVKEFLLEKQPKTDVHRVTCLAYYLTHYRETPHFKTLDISKLNTEAAQPKFANAAKSVDNATKLGYLVQATKGNKQLSAIGERFVQALPDQDAARALLLSIRARRRSKRASSISRTIEQDGNAES